MAPREDIYAALFALLKSLTVGGQPAFNTASRRLVHWNDVATADQPALFQAQIVETATSTNSIPTLWEFRVDLYLYAHTDGTDKDTPSSILNPLIDAVVEVLKPQSFEQTLGGLVTRCRIDGPTQTDEGVLGNQAVCIIPVVIVVPQ
jgi:hypothetical protein